MKSRKRTYNHLQFTFCFSIGGVRLPHNLRDFTAADPLSLKHLMSRCEECISPDNNHTSFLGQTPASGPLCIITLPSGINEIAPGGIWTNCFGSSQSVTYESRQLLLNYVNYIQRQYATGPFSHATIRLSQPRTLLI